MFKKCHKDKIIVVRNKKNKVVRTGYNKVVFVPPFCKFDYLDLNPIKLSLEKFAFRTRDEDAELLLSAEIYYGISEEECVYTAAIDYFLGKNFKEYESASRQMILDELKEVILDDKIASVHKRMDLFAKSFYDRLRGITTKFGLKVININYKDMYDTAGIIEEICREKAAKAIIDTCIKIGEPIPEHAQKYMERL